MSNRFKNNSRFGSLVDEDKRDVKNKEPVKLQQQCNKEQTKLEEVKKESGFNSFKNEGNSFKNEGNSFRNNRNFRDRDRIFAEQAEKESQRLENEKKKIEEEKQKGLAIENFPTLMSSNILPKVNDNKKSISFLEKVTTNNIKNNEDINKEKLEFDDLKPGWSILKTNSLTNQTIIKTKVIVSSEKEQILSESDIVYNVLNGLTNLYERRKQEYIDSWGEDEYEKMFKFQNYNYNYFDELDEKYEKEMKKYSEYYGENDNEYEDDEYYE